MKTNSQAALAAAVIADRFDGVPVDVLRRANLLAYAYRRGGDHAEARAAFLSLTTRHEVMKCQLLPLLGAWRTAGIEALLYKGFALAEWVYEYPAERFFGDVDVLIRPRDAHAALRVAAALGWRVLGRGGGGCMWPRYSDHVFALSSPRRAVYLEAHRWVVPTVSPLSPVSRLTRAAWAASRPLVWEGVPVRVLSDPDAVLLGLILNRCWGDRTGLKPHDYLDLRALAERAGLSRDVLLGRARELRLGLTCRSFLGCCDPWRELLDGRERRGLRRIGSEVVAALAGERFPVTLERVLMRCARAPALSIAVASILPELLRARALVRRHHDLCDLFAATPAATRKPRDAREIERLARAVRWGARLLRPLLARDEAGLCLVASLALFRLLRLRGYAARFVSGVERAADESPVTIPHPPHRIRGHAWVEVAGVPVAHDQVAPHLYRESFSFPPRRNAAGGAVRPVVAPDPYNASGPVRETASRRGGTDSNIRGIASAAAARP